MPTFDFANIVRKAVALLIGVAHNPVAICTALSVAVGAIVALAIQYSVQEFVPTISLPQINLPSDTTGIQQLVLYCLDTATLNTILSRFFNLLTGYIVFIVSAVSSYFVALWAYRFAFAVRNSFKDKAS